MRWDFDEVSYDQDTMYGLLTRYWNLGKAPLFFPVSNTSADYVNGDWMDPCYERFYEIGAKYIVYWFVNGDMYCEAVVRGPNINYTATFKQEF
uniref:Uncharacterized protein n=1 Tax=Caenorhabditis japonica TaxID=281687 RepID=A0A8R1EWB0_CAEJA